MKSENEKDYGLMFNIKFLSRLYNENISFDQYKMHGSDWFDADFDPDRLKLIKLKQYMSIVMPMFVANHNILPLPEARALLYALRSAFEICSNEGHTSAFDHELYIIMKQFRSGCDLLTSRQAENESIVMLKKKEEITKEFLKAMADRIQLENNTINTVNCLGCMALKTLPQESSQQFHDLDLQEICKLLVWIEEVRPQIRHFMHAEEDIWKIQQFIDALCKNTDAETVAKKFLYTMKASGHILAEGRIYESLLRLSLIIKYFGYHLDSTTLLSIFLESNNEVIPVIISQNFMEHLISFPHDGSSPWLDKILAFVAVIYSRLSISSDMVLMTETNGLPLLLHLWLREYPPEVYARFLGFNSKCKKINAQCDAFHQYNLDLLFIEHFPAITQMVRIMGCEGIALLSNKIAHSLQPLLHFCENMAILPDSLQEYLSQYFDVWRDKIRKNQKELQAFEHCLRLLGVLFFASRKWEDQKNFCTLYEDIFSPDNNQLPPSACALKLANVLYKRLIGECSDKTDESLADIFARMPLERITQLFVASSKMQHDEYREVYHGFLKRDILGEDINEFLHNMEQENQVGQAIARHNRKIHDTLLSLKIDPDFALRYPKVLSLSINVEPDDNEVQSQLALFNTLWADLLALDGIIKRENLSSLPLTLREAFEPACRQFERIHKRIETSGESALTVLGKKVPELHAIRDSLLKAIVVMNESSVMNASLFEYAMHYIEHFKAYVPARKQHTKQDTLHFSVRQWNKGSPDTFFLGNEVGCCLATNGGQFQAMVQRRLDDAMLFHVAVDESSNRPAALVWLFFAETVDGQLALVANFFEVHTRYGKIPQIRKELLNGLLAFTAQYCEDNGIEIFLMNPLTYGLNTDDLNHIPVTEVAIKDKLGGAFVPDDEYEYDADNAARLTKELYYIASLQKEDQNFHILHINRPEPEIKLEDSNDFGSVIAGLCEFGRFRNNISSKEQGKPGTFSMSDVSGFGFASTGQLP